MSCWCLKYRGRITKAEAEQLGIKAGDVVVAEETQEVTKEVQRRERVSVSAGSSEPESNQTDRIVSHGTVITVSKGPDAWPLGVTRDSGERLTVPLAGDVKAKWQPEPGERVTVVVVVETKTDEKTASSIRVLGTVKALEAAEARAKEERRKRSSDDSAVQALQQSATNAAVQSMMQQSTQPPSPPAYSSPYGR
jgi:hypothetical protein